MSKFLRLLAKDMRGATAVEYGLILAFIVIAMVSSLSLVAGETVGMWNDIASQYPNN